MKANNKKAKSKIADPKDYQHEISTLVQMIGEAGLSDSYNEYDAFRFLKARNFDIEKAITLILADYKWRQDVNIKQITAANIYEQLQTQKFIFPGTKDKQGRPIIIFNARKHSPNSNFLETFKLALYAFELALQHLGDAKDITIIEDLSHFTPENADNRMVKFLIEFGSSHYPGRIGKFIAVNAPWYYRLLCKVVKPWLSNELASKVSILGEGEGLQEFVDVDQLTVELGGTFKFNFEDFIQERFRVEGFSLENVNEHHISPSILATISDRGVDEVMTSGGKLSGWLKKEGGFVKKFNNRFCVLHLSNVSSEEFCSCSILFYFKDKHDTKAEGFVDLYNSKLVEMSSLTFKIITNEDKHCIFRASEKEDYHRWITLIKECISLTERKSRSNNNINKSGDNPDDLKLSQNNNNNNINIEASKK